MNQLKTYHDKRDFDKTSEPSPGKAERSAGLPVFVIQKHDASSLHYDFRLEINGVLKSWAVPKGPSTDPSEKRLAIETEDHPLDYQNFEGVIPEDEYGGGTVMIWDRGSYQNISEKDGENIPIDEACSKGHVSVRLAGEKLRGGYTLVHTSGKKWLLIKMDDDDADARRNPTSTETKSVASGRSMKTIAREERPD